MRHTVQFPEAQVAGNKEDPLPLGKRLPRARFRLADGEYLSWHGSRTPDGVDYAAGLVRAARSRPRARR